MTTLFYKALISQGEIWCWSLLGIKGLTLWREKFHNFLRLRTFSYLFAFILVFSFFLTRIFYIYSYFSFLSFTFDNFSVLKRIHLVKHIYLIGKIAERVLDIVEASNVINDPKCNKGLKCNNFWP